MKIVDCKDAINCRLYNNQSFVETAIYRVSSLNPRVLKPTDVGFNTLVRLCGREFV
ncbi:hypothetical protein H6H01_20135 [Nostoc calcicola FACHB-3891]|nr:hypothetical protein [Nostoc calcicola FACHB-3891]MDZ8060554.1 hypothetical protein [Nostoc sp. EkiNYC01]